MTRSFYHTELFDSVCCLIVKAHIPFPATRVSQSCFLMALLLTCNLSGNINNLKFVLVHERKWTNVRQWSRKLKHLLQMKSGAKSCINYSKKHNKSDTSVEAARVQRILRLKRYESYVAADLGPFENLWDGFELLTALSSLKERET